MARNPSVSAKNLFRYHVENLRSLLRAIDQIETLSKDAIKRRQDEVAKSLLCMHIFLVGASTECRLKKLLFEPGGFTKIDRDAIKSVDTQEGKWKNTIELGFKRRYSVSTLSSKTLGHTAFGRYRAMLDAITNDIAPVVMIRNKLAHGQWEYQLTNGDDGIAEEAMRVVRTENLLSSKFKIQIITHLSALVHDLVVSDSFERDFDDHYRKFEAARDNLKNRSYPEYVSQLRDRYDRGQASRKSS